MITLPIFAVAFTFTATATGVEKGTPIEFFFAGADTDRGYESMFLIDVSVDEFCRRIEGCGIPCGKPVDAEKHQFWPVGCAVELSPPLEDFIDTAMPTGLSLGSIIYTGGTRNADGSLEAAANMPLAVFCMYSLAQSPLVFNGIYSQGIVYNCHKAKKTLKKGEKVEFSLVWDGELRTKSLALEVKPGNAQSVIKTLHTESANCEVEALVDFSPELDVREAISVAKSLQVIDSPNVKINGCVPGHLYYGAFTPLVSWLDRKERLMQPYELNMGETNSLVFIEEDWSVDGLDPMLTPRSIPFSEASEHPTDTCFIYTSSSCKLGEVYRAMAAIVNSKVRTWYVYVRE